MTERKQYQNPFTLDGKLQPQRGVTVEKVKQAKTLLERALNGDYEADAKLRRMVTAEAYSTSDLAPAIAHLISLQTIPKMVDPQYSVDGLVSTRTVKDFNPAVLYSLYGNLKGAGLDANGAPVRVPEGSPYPTVTVEGQESFYANLAKRGLRFDFTWEAQVNDTAGFFADLPGEILNLAYKAAYAEALDAILSAGAASTLAGGTLPNGVVVKKNSKISPDAIWEAKLEHTNRTINGVKLGQLSGYNVLVPIGRKDWIDYQLNEHIIDFTKNTLRLSGDSYYQGALGNITTVETPRLSGDAWLMLPKPGATQRPSVELLKLRGYENAELRVRQDGGDSSYDTDTKSFRLRYVVGGALWDEKYIIKSDGSEA